MKLDIFSNCVIDHIHIDNSIFTVPGGPACYCSFTARALKFDVKLQGIGIGERAERLLVIAIIGIIGFMEYAVIIVIIIAAITLIQRIIVTANELKE